MHELKHVVDKRNGLDMSDTALVEDSARDAAMILAALSMPAHQYGMTSSRLQSNH